MAVSYTGEKLKIYLKAWAALEAAEAEMKSAKIGLRTIVDRGKIKRFVVGDKILRVYHKIDQGDVEVEVHEAEEVIPGPS